MDLPQLGLLECCSSQSSPPQCVLLNVVFLRVFLLRSDLYGQVLSVSAWSSSVRSDLPHVDRSRRGWLPQRGRLPRRAPLCFSAGSLQSFSQGFFPNGFLFLRMVLPGALFSSVQFSTLLFPPRGSPWHGSPPVHPQRSSTACVALWFSKQFSQRGTRGRSAWQRLWPPMRQVPAAGSRGKSMPRSRGSIFVSWPRLHLRLASKAPSSFHCLGPIFIPLWFHIHSVAAAPSSFHLRSVLLPRLNLRFADCGSVFTLTTVAGDGFEAN